MKLSKLQEKIVNAPEPRIVVHAAAAAGKTAVLTERVRKMLRDGINPSDIVCITFTNLAAQEMRDRLANDYKNGIYIGTIHGLANYFLLSHGIDTSDLIESQEFDKFFERIEENPFCVKHIKHILLDEAQDSSPAQYKFIFEMIKPDTFFIVGDLRQSIYSFRGGDPEILENIMNRLNVTVYSLNENYRNGDNILRYAKKILQKSFMTDDSIAMRHGGTVWEGEATFDNLKGWIQRKGDFRDWAVLCTTNGTIADLQSKFEKVGIPTVTFRQGEVDKSKLEELMNSNTVKVLTYWSAKGLEFPYVAAWEPKNWGGDETYRVNYVGATRAKDILLWMEGPKKKKKDKWF